MNVTVVLEATPRGGPAGFGTSRECEDCGKTWYQPSNYEKFADTNGLDPDLYPREVAELRRLRGW